jgi:hypothetical protein
MWEGNCCFHPKLLFDWLWILSHLFYFIFSVHHLYFFFQFANAMLMFTVHHILTCWHCFLGVSDPRLHLAQSLYRLSVAYPGRLSPLLRTGVSDANRIYLKHYLDAAGVQLVWSAFPLNCNKERQSVFVCVNYVFFLNIT